MTRKIIRVWVEYEPDASLHRYIEPIYPDSRTLIKEILRGQIKRNNPSLRVKTIFAPNGHFTNMKYISTQRMDQLEEIVRKIDSVYQENQYMTEEEIEKSISGILW